MHRFAVATTLLFSIEVLAGAPEVTLKPDDDQLIAAICEVASIPGPHGVGSQFAVGALVEGQDRVKKKGDMRITEQAARHGWVTFVTEESTLHVSAEQYTKDLKEAVRLRRLYRFPAPCVVHSAMQVVVLTAVILTERGYVGIVDYDGTVKTLPTPEPDKKKAMIATMKLANGLAKNGPLTPAWLKDLAGGRKKSCAESGWAEAAESTALEE